MEMVNNVSVLIMAVGIIAFVTAVITQVTKGWGFLDRIPTALQVYVTSLVLTVLTVLVYLQWNNMKIIWYYIVGAVILSFFVSFVVTNGWDQLSELWSRYNKGSK